MKKLFDRTGMSMDDIGLRELNEAFAVVAIYCRERIGESKKDRRINPAAKSELLADAPQSGD